MSKTIHKSFKDTGAEWLGSVPNHWQIKKLGHHFTERREKVSDKEFEPLSVTKKGIVPQLDTAAKSDDNENRKKVCLGDFVINGRSDRKGSAGIAPQSGSVSLINIVLQPRNIDWGFVHYLLRSRPFQEEFYRCGKGIVADLWTTNYSEMKNIIMATPPLQEQIAITNFLDREIAKIDELIGEQQRLTELLLEKRHAIVSHAVTKGLNPNVPMRDTGIEWLGEVPEHWKPMPIKYLGLLKGGCGFPNEEQGIKGEELSFHKVNALAQAKDNGVLQPSENTISRETATRLGAFIFPPFSIVFAKVGAALLLGRIRTIDHPACIDNNMMGLMVHSCQHHVAFIVYAMQMVHFDYISNPGAVPSLNESQIGDFMLGIPPREEQHMIAAYLDEEILKIDTLTFEVERAVTLLQQRRNALITAAVTGKISVISDVTREPNR